MGDDRKGQPISMDKKPIAKAKVLNKQKNWVDFIGKLLCCTTETDFSPPAEKGYIFYQSKVHER